MSTIDQRVAEVVRRMFQSFTYEPAKWHVVLGEGGFLVSKHVVPGQSFKAQTRDDGDGYVETLRIPPEIATQWHALAQARYLEQEKVRSQEATLRFLERLETVFVQ